MNILVLAHNQDDGSPYVSFVHSQVRAYIKLGHSVTVISPVTVGKKYSNWTGKKHVVVDGVSIYYIPCISFSNYGKYFLNNYFGYFSIRRVVKKLLKIQKYDIIHAHTIGYDGNIAVMLKKKFSIPVVITTHGSDIFVEKRAGKEDYISEICKKANGIVGVSTKLKDALLEISPELESKLNVVMNGFEHLVFSDLKKKYTILQVGSLIPRKKVDITIKAFKKIVSLFPEATLTIIGEGGELERLKKLCQILNLEQKVTFIGQIKNNEVLSWMGKSEIFIMPSVNEGMGIVYLEAMNSGCITIGTFGEGITDIIENGVNGFLANPDDVEEISDLFKICFSMSEEEKRNMAKKAKKTVNSLTWENNAKRYIKIFENILAEEK